MIEFSHFSLSGGGSAIYGERLAGHETCPRAAQPENGGSDFLGLTKPLHWIAAHHVLHSDPSLGYHIRNHWRLDGSRAHGIDANASGGILKRSTPGQTNHAKLG